MGCGGLQEKGARRIHRVLLLIGLGFLVTGFKVEGFKVRVFVFCKATRYIAFKLHGLTVEASLKMSWFSVGGFGLRRKFEKASRG